jgi:hypothetical protein
MSAADYQKFATRTMTEAEWRRLVRELATHHGWELLIEIPDRAYRVLAEAATTDKSLMPTLAALRGWPDLVFGNRALGQLAFMELKRERGAVKPHQIEKMAQLAACGMPGRVWRPGDRDELETFLMTGGRDE